MSSAWPAEERIRSAARAAVSVQTVYDACAVGTLKHVRIEGRRNIRVKPEWVDEWMMQFVVETR